MLASQLIRRPARSCARTTRPVPKSSSALKDSSISAMAYWSILSIRSTGGRCPAGRADRLRLVAAGAPQGSPGARVPDPPGCPGRGSTPGWRWSARWGGERQEQLASARRRTLLPVSRKWRRRTRWHERGDRAVGRGLLCVPAARDPGAERPRHTRRRLRGAHARAQTRPDVVSPRDPTLCGSG